MKSRKAARNTKKQYILHLAKIKKRENIIVDFSSSFNQQQQKTFFYKTIIKDINIIIGKL